MPLREDHRGVEADHREAPGDLEDRLDDGLADVGLEVVELGGVVPREARPVVAVVDVAPLARRPVAPLEHDGGVGVVPVVVLEADLDPIVVGQVVAGERVGGERRLGDRDEPLGVIDHPARVDPHVVGDHVAREPDAAGRGPVAEVRVGSVATEVVGDPVVVEGIRRGDGIRVAAPALDLLGARERSHSPISQSPVIPRRAS